MAKAIRKKAATKEAAPTTTTVVQTEKPVTGTTVLSFTRPSPMWATWIFRTEFILNKAILFWMSGTTEIPTAKAKEYILIMAAIDLAFWLFAKSLGVKKTDIENELN